MSEATCEERIAEQLAGRVDHLSTLFRAYDGAEDLSYGEMANLEGCMHDGVIEEELVSERLYELPLSVTKTELYTVLLSTGGPGDWLEAEYDREADSVNAVRYHFQDWFDHAEVRLEGADREVAERYVRFITGDFS